MANDDLITNILLVFALLLTVDVIFFVMIYMFVLAAIHTSYRRNMNNYDVTDFNGNSDSDLPLSLPNDKT